MPAEVKFHPEVVIEPALAAFQIAADGAVEVAQAAAPRKTGALAASIKFSALGGGAGEIQAFAEYAPFQEYGSRPHFISPSAALCLYNPSDSHGNEFGPVAGTVGHPGTEAKGFLEKGGAAFPELFKEAFEALL